MAAGSTRLGFVPLVLGRLIRRRRSRGAGSGGARGLAWIAAALALACSLAVVAGPRGPWIIAGAWLGWASLLVGWVASRLRLMLTVSVLGLALGVASLFVVLGVASGAEQVLVSSLARLNGHAMISKYGLDFFEYREVTATLQADPRVRAVSPYVIGAGAIVVLDSEDSEPLVVMIKGVDPQALAGFSAAKELFAEGDFDALRPAGPRTPPGIVVGTRLARRLDVALGARVRLVVPESIHPDQATTSTTPRHGEFEVLGLLDTGFAEFDASVVLVHLTAGQALIYGERRVSGLELEFVEGRGLDGISELAHALAEGLDEERLARGAPALYRASSWVERSDQIQAIRQTKLVLVVVVGLIIVVASSSLIGALLLMLRRERPQIAVFSAMGARPSQVFWVFEATGAAIGVLGSGLGLGLGALSLGALSLMRIDLDPGVYRVDHLPVAFMFSDMVLPVALAMVVCLVATGPIALQASRLRPIEGLKA